jgi:hypothetical protein
MFNINANLLNQTARQAQARINAVNEAEAMKILVHELQPNLIAAAEAGSFCAAWNYSGVSYNVVSIIVRKLTNDYGFTTLDDDYEMVMTIRWDAK